MSCVATLKASYTGVEFSHYTLPCFYHPESLTPSSVLSFLFLCTVYTHIVKLTWTSTSNLDDWISLCWCELKLMLVSKDFQFQDVLWVWMSFKQLLQRQPLFLLHTTSLISPLLYPSLFLPSSPRWRQRRIPGTLMRSSQLRPSQSLHQRNVSFYFFLFFSF